MNERATLINQLKIDRGGPQPEGGFKPIWAVAGAGALIVLAAAGWFILKPSGIPVHVVEAKAIAADSGVVGGSLLDASGYVIPRFQATVSSNIIDKVVEVPIEEGQYVEKGQLLARLDDSNWKALLEQAKAAVKQTEAALTAAKITAADGEPIYQRDVSQLAQGLISQETFDAAKATYDAQKVAVIVAEQNLAATTAAAAYAQANEDYTRIYAPFSGMITTISTNPGDLVSSSFSAGGGIATLVDMDSLEVQVDVSENFINRVKAKQPAIITLNAYPDWRIPAQVIAIIPTADQSKATVKVRVAFKQKDARVLPQMGARVSFLADEDTSKKSGTPAATAGVIVPPEAVKADGEMGTIYVLKDKTVEQRKVKLGARSGDGQIVLSGIVAGDKLAVGDMAQLKDGAKVHVE